MKTWGKKLKCWKLFGIVFGTVHIVLLSLTFMGTGEGRAYGVAIIELPLFIIRNITYDWFGINILNFFWINDYFFFFVGTLFYMILGAFIGCGIDKMGE